MPKSPFAGVHDEWVRLYVEEGREMKEIAHLFNCSQPTVLRVLQAHGVIRRHRSPVDKFWSRVTKGGAGECWVYTGNPDRHGYGRCSFFGKRRFAHRIAYEMTHGSIPDSCLIRHLCHNTSCVNPAHLEVGTPRENTADSVKAGRMARGSRHGNAKLTEDDVRFILAYPRTLGSGLYLAERFGVSKSAISKIRMGDKWQHLMRPAA